MLRGFMLWRLVQPCRLRPELRRMMSSSVGEDVSVKSSGGVEDGEGELGSKILDYLRRKGAQTRPRLFRVFRNEKTKREDIVKTLRRLVKKNVLEMKTTPGQGALRLFTFSIPWLRKVDSQLKRDSKNRIVGKLSDDKPIQTKVKAPPSVLYTKNGKRRYHSVDPQFDDLYVQRLQAWRERLKTRIVAEKTARQERQSTPNV